MTTVSTAEEGREEDKTTEMGRDGRSTHRATEKRSQLKKERKRESGWSGEWLLLWWWLLVEFNPTCAA